MGGINCDNSNGRTQMVSAQAAELSRVDSKSYHLAVVHFSKTLFSAYRRFLEFNECIEDLLIFEEAGATDMSLFKKHLAATLSSYHQQLQVAVTSGEVLHRIETSRFEALLVSETGSSYKALSESDDVQKAEEEGLIPAWSKSMDENTHALNEGGDSDLIKLHAKDLAVLVRLCEGLQQPIETLTVGQKSLALAIREVDTPLLPYCLRSMTLWITIMTRQVQWAHHNTLAFRSVSGATVSTQQLIKDLG